MATLDQFLPYVLPHAVGCPTTLARRSILAAAIELSQRALVLEKFEQLDSAVDTQDYTLDVPDDCVITRFKDVMFNGYPLGPTSREMIRYSPALIGADSGTAEILYGTPQSFYQKVNNTPIISLYPGSDTAIVGGIVVVYWYEPARNATTVPDLIFNMYLDDIVNGALARILLVPGQSFTNRSEANVRSSWFSAGVRNAGITSRTGQVAVSSRVQMRRFAI